MIIEKIYVDDRALDFPLTERVQRKLQGVPFEIVRDREEFLKSAPQFTLSQGKRTLWITCHEGPFVKPCPGTGEPYLCCGYWVINLQTGCPLDCSYCILQEYLNQPWLTLYANTDRILDEMDQLLEKNPGRLVRIGTGELTDSLALNPFTQVHEGLIERASQRENLLFELKTKTDFVGHLPPISGRRNVIVSWSLNPDGVIEEEEHKSAPLRERLEAASRAVAKGYRVGFHFDPVVEVPEWERAYRNLIEQMTQALPEKEVAWISLGTLRFPPSLKRSADERFPRSRVFLNEWIKGLDGKMRYLRPVRTELYRRISGWIRERWESVFIYFCMEHPAVWQDVFGFSPENHQHLDRLFEESLLRRFPDLQKGPRR